MPDREEFPTMHHPIRVLFLCTGNSARSQMAEALLRSYGGTDFEVASAGTDPKGLNPLTIEVMAEAGIDVSKQQSKSLDRFLDQSFDYVITVCDRARDNCPTFPGDNERIHWSFDDPAAATGSHEQQLAVFRRVRNEISERLRLWVAVQRKQLSEKRPRG
jgi:arsenate reductase